MIRISGVVKTATQVQSALQQGIPPQEVKSFQEFIQKSLQAIEQICDRHNTSPEQLPARSRNAYYYLKSINFDNLSIRTVAQGIQPPNQPPTLRIKNVLKQQAKM